ncbi:MAG: efflux RND transporter periplasmic adaptor subunit [Draconibacterium sp.]|nr:efflux RND transporter periplasmic adaptor subunit [Draconibacterium sp.]
MNKITTIGLKGIFIVLLAIVLINCAPKQQVKIPPQEINVILVQQKDIKSYLEYVGQVYGYKDISIRARVDGFLDGIHFDEGFPVKKGQLLYTIDSQPYEAEVLNFQSKVAEAKTLYVKAESDLNRYKPLAESNAVSQSDLDAAQAQFDAATASVQAAESSLELAKIKLGYTRIMSPIKGIIGKSEAKVGEYVGKMPNAVILNTVSQIDKILVEFFLPENQYMQLIRYFGSADSLFNSSNNDNKILELILADNSTLASKGFISFLDRAVDQNTGALLVQAEFDNKKRIVRPGQYAKVKIPFNYKDAIVIPQKCVIELQGQFSVFIVNSENKIESRPIVVGAKIDDFWVIEDGLKVEEKVVIDGIQKVHSGVEVNAAEIEFKSQSNSN